MTICTSSIIKIAARSTASLLCVLAAACGASDTAAVGNRTSSTQAAATPPPAAQLATAVNPKRPDPPLAENTDLSAAYTRDVAAALAGRHSDGSPPSGAFGMRCNPARIATTSPDLVLELPSPVEQRRHVLAVVTPERGLLEIYSPYGDDAEEGDLTLPSDVISWARARTQARFTVQASELDGLRPGAEQPEALFLEAGRYRFVLVNGIDAELLAANGTPVSVFAACAFDWKPEVARPR